MVTNTTILYKQYQNKVFSQAKETHEEVVLAMKNFNYGEVIVEMQAIQSSDIVGEVLFQQAKRALNLILNDFMEATRHKAITIGNDIPREKK
ncbi:unnamed protein product [Rotaria sordida]|uniref:Uncharacterized protein n=1 Tax=Rotaria sordida TaxID=392033 RepID=A0A819J6N8_9BILA|nr:unnamed protein product [Rotaria sordida]CAF3928300.1 unnamed protein product [Rotaria sordida]